VRTIEVDGRQIYVPDKDAALHLGGLKFGTNLRAELYRNKRGNKHGLGRKLDEIDLGSGLVTNVGALAMIYDWNVASPSTAINILRICNNHGSGVGTNAAATTDITLQTAISGTPTAATAGAWSAVFAANSQKMQNVATIAYGSNNAVTEWGLFSDTVYSATTGTPFTATSVSTGTVTATPLTASSSSVQGEQQHIVCPGTTAVWGYVISNSTSVFTIPAWYKVSDGTLGSTPGSTEAFSIKPVMWDHKVFAAINVVGGTDSIVFTYLLTITSGG
jgi:hypothetical protein